MGRFALACVVLVPWLTACAANDVRPPSPAQHLSPLDLLAIEPPANERYYLLVFASQSRPKVPRFSHTWATVVKVTESETDEDPALIEHHTISWLPSTLKIKPLRFRVEDGANLELHATIKEMRSHRERVSMWGPYETWHGFYHRFLVQKEFLDSCQIGYQCVDTIGEAPRYGNGCDCIHAISDMDPMFDRTRYPLAYFGDAASRNIVKQIRERPVLIRPNQTHDWLIPALGLNCYPIVRREECGCAAEFSPERVAALWERTRSACGDSAGQCTGGQCTEECCTEGL